MSDEIIKKISTCEGYCSAIVKILGDDFEEINEIKELLTILSEKAKEDRPLKIVFAGQMNTSKSLTADNLLFGGAGILSSSPTPSTAKITRISYSETDSIEVTYMDQFDLDALAMNAKKYANATGNPSELKYKNDYELYNDIEKADNFPKDKIGITEIISVTNLGQYTDVGGRYTPYVKEINIRLNKDILKKLICVDVPGINDPVISRDIIAKTDMIRADVVFYLSVASSFMDSLDIEEYFELKKYGVRNVVILAAKFDECIKNIDYTDNDLSTSVRFERLNHDFIMNLKDKCNTKGLDYKDYEPSGVFPVCALAAKIKNSLDRLDDRLIASKSSLETKCKIDFSENYVHKFSGIETLNDWIKIFRQKKEEIQFNNLQDGISGCFSMLDELLKERIINLNNQIKACDLYLNNPDKYMNTLVKFNVFTAKSKEFLVTKEIDLDEEISKKCDALIKKIKVYKKNVKVSIDQASNEKVMIREYIAFSDNINDLVYGQLRDIFSHKRKKLFRKTADSLKEKLVKLQKDYIDLNNPEDEELLTGSINAICSLFGRKISKMLSDIKDDIYDDIEKCVNNNLNEPQVIYAKIKETQVIDIKHDSDCENQDVNEAAFQGLMSGSPVKKTIDNTISSIEKEINKLKNKKVPDMLEKLCKDIAQKIDENLQEVKMNYRDRTETDIQSRKINLTADLQKLDDVQKSIEASYIDFEKNISDE